MCLENVVKKLDVSDNSIRILSQIAENLVISTVFFSGPCTVLTGGCRQCPLTR